MNYSPLRFLPALFRKATPIQLTVFLTRRCNARCTFCFYLSQDTPAASCREELSLEELTRVAADVGNLLWLAFSGGEFFLRPDFVDVVDAFYRNSKPSIILLPTNGIATDLIVEKVEAIAERCPKSTVVVKVSLDGPEETHDRLRGLRGAHRKAMETCKALGGLAGRYRNLEVGVNSVFCQANQEELDDLIGEVRNLHAVTTHTVSMVRGQVGDVSLKEVDWNLYERTADGLAAHLRQSRASRYRFSGARLKAAQDIVQRRLIRQTADRHSAQGPCYAGKLTLVLTEAGDVYPCESFTRRIGNVRVNGYDLRRMLRQKEARAKVEAINRDGCWCTHECYHMMNILFNPRRLPDLAREYLSLPGSFGQGLGAFAARSTCRRGMAETPG